MSNDLWNYFVRCEYASKMQNGTNKRQKNRSKEHSATEWVCAILAGLIVLIGVIFLDN